MADDGRLGQVHLRSHRFDGPRRTLLVCRRLDVLRQILQAFSLLDQRHGSMLLTRPSISATFARISIPAACPATEPARRAVSALLADSRSTKDIRSRCSRI